MLDHGHDRTVIGPRSRRDQVLIFKPSDEDRSANLDCIFDDG